MSEDMNVPRIVGPAMDGTLCCYVILLTSPVGWD